jgi:hypothetical protein
MYICVCSNCKSPFREFSSSVCNLHSYCHQLQPCCWINHLQLRSIEHSCLVQTCGTISLSGTVCNSALTLSNHVQYQTYGYLLTEEKIRCSTRVLPITPIHTSAGNSTWQIAWSIILGNFLIFIPNMYKHPWVISKLYVLLNQQLACAWPCASSWCRSRGPIPISKKKYSMRHKHAVW